MQCKLRNNLALLDYDSINRANGHIGKLQNSIILHESSFEAESVVARDGLLKGSGLPNAFAKPSISLYGFGFLKDCIMRAFTVLGLLATTCMVAARSPQHVGKRLSKPAPNLEPRRAQAYSTNSVKKFTPRHLNSKTKSIFAFPWSVAQN